MRLPPQIAARTSTFFTQNVEPEKLFFAVLCGFPAFLFQSNPAILGAEIALFFFLNLFRRGKSAVLSPALILAGVAFFNLLTPYGKILFRIGSFVVTKGALLQGLRRGEILVGMVCMSQAALSSNLALPGGAGKFLADIFGDFNRITAKKISVVPGHILAAIDDRLFESYFGSDVDTSGPLSGAAQPKKSAKTSIAGWTLLILLPALLYSVLVFV
jgi:hypothetical protein